MVPDDVEEFAETYLNEVFGIYGIMGLLDRISEYDYRVRGENAYPWFKGLEDYSYEELKKFIRIGLYFVQPDTYFLAICSEILRRYCMSAESYEAVKEILHSEIDLEPMIRTLWSSIARQNLTNNYVKAFGKKLLLNGNDKHLWENNVLRLCLFLDSSISPKTPYGLYSAVYCCLELGSIGPLETCDLSQMNDYILYCNAFSGGYVCSLEWLKKKGMKTAYISDALNVETLVWSFQNGLQLDSFLIGKIIEKKRNFLIEWVLDNCTITDAIFHNILDAAIWSSNIDVLELLVRKGYTWTISCIMKGVALHTKIIEWHIGRFPWGDITGDRKNVLLTKVQSDILQRAGCPWNIQYYTAYYDMIGS